MTEKEMTRQEWKQTETTKGKIGQKRKERA